MDRLTLRSAAKRTGLSVTTLRRYIRSGRLLAVKAPGRFGPEYTVSPLDLERAGAPCLGSAQAGSGPASLEVPEPPSAEGAGAISPRPASAAATLGDSLLRDVVPIDLYRELAMKHEQLLVQYGMFRVGGQRMMEYKIEAENLAEQVRRVEEAARAEREHGALEIEVLRRRLRESELSLEAKSQEILALLERVRLLELVSRNAITNESIEQQFHHVFNKRMELAELAATSSDERRRKMAALEEILKAGFRMGGGGEPTDQ